jgi:hypothetical protein
MTKTDKDRAPYILQFALRSGHSGVIGVHNTPEPGEEWEEYIAREIAHVRESQSGVGVAFSAATDDEVVIGTVQRNAPDEPEELADEPEAMGEAREIAQEVAEEWRRGAAMPWHRLVPVPPGPPPPDHPADMATERMLSMFDSFERVLDRLVTVLEAKQKED